MLFAPDMAHLLANASRRRLKRPPPRADAALSSAACGSPAAASARWRPGVS